MHSRFSLSRGWELSKEIDLVYQRSMIMNQILDSSHVEAIVECEMREKISAIRTGRALQTLPQQAKEVCES